MGMPKIPKEKIIYYWVGSIFAVVLLLYIFLYEPLINKFKRAGNACKAVESQVMETRNSLKALKISETRKVLIAEKNISLVIAELTKSSKSKEIDFISITPQPIIEVGDPQYKILPVEMDIESTYEELIEFINSFSELKEGLVTLGDFTITPDNKSETLKVKLIINVYIPIT